MLAVTDGALNFRSEAADPDNLTKKITGERAQPGSPHKADDSLVVWTFKPYEIVRLDAIDLEIRRKVREMPIVERWYVDRKKVVCRWKLWNDRLNRPSKRVESEERFRLRSLSEKELVLLVVARQGRPVAEEELTSSKRFPGCEGAP